MEHVDVLESIQKTLNILKKKSVRASEEMRLVKKVIDQQHKEIADLKNELVIANAIIENQRGNFESQIGINSTQHDEIEKLLKIKDQQQEEISYWREQIEQLKNELARNEKEIGDLQKVIDQQQQEMTDLKFKLEQQTGYADYWRDKFSKAEDDQKALEWFRKNYGALYWRYFVDKRFE